MNPEEIRRVGRWPVVRFIGAGGFSWVFEVLDEELGRACALKFLRPEAAQGEQYRRFQRESRLLASFNDPHIVTVFERGQDERTGCHFYVMELFTGQDLKKVLQKEGSLEWQRAAEIFAGTLRALGLMHAHQPDQIIHRDVKPGNIQLTAEAQAKLFDLGIARIQQATPSANDDPTLTTNQSFIGTVRYASPEQIKLRELSPASDVFSVGLCIFEALTGTHPYERLPGATAMGYSYSIVSEFYALAARDGNELRLDYGKKDVPVAIRKVIEKAVRLDPRQRYSDANKMRVALLRAVEEGRAAGKQPGRLWGLLVRAALASVCSLIVAAGYWYLHHRPVSSPAVAPLPPQSVPLPAPPGEADLERDRAAALEVQRELEGLAPDAFPADQRSQFEQILEEAERAWQRSSLDEARHAYNAATSLGRQMLAPAIKKLREHLAAARESAVAKGAQGQELEQADQVAQEASADGPDLGNRLRQAIAAYEKAGDQGAKRLGDATARQKLAEQRVAGECALALHDSSECTEASKLLTMGGEELRLNHADTAIQDFDKAERLVRRIPPPEFTLTHGDLSDLRVGGSTLIHARPKSADRGPLVFQFELTDPGGVRETRSGTEDYNFQPSIPGMYILAATATDQRGKSLTQTLQLNVREKVAVNPPGSTPSPRPVPSPSRKLLEEYEQAIKNCDRDTLATLVPKEVSQVIGHACDKYPSLDATVAYLSEERGTKGTTVHFTQKIEGVSATGEIEMIAQAKLKATVVQETSGELRILDIARDQ